MRRLSLFHTLAVSMSLLNAVLCVILVGFMSLSFYYFADQEVKSALTEAGAELSSDYLVLNDSQIQFVQPTERQSMTNFLRSRDLSAVVFAQDFSRVGTFGIYRELFSLPDSAAISQSISTARALQTSNQAHFSHLTAQKMSYEIYTVPLKMGTETVGYLQLAKQTEFVNRLQQLIPVLLLLFLLPSLALTWLLSYKLVHTFLRPLRQLTALFSSLSVTSFPSSLNTRSPFAEIHEIANACNSMLSRLRSGFENQKYFTAFASHELKTPLTQAISSLEVLELSATSSTAMELATIADQVAQANKTLDGLLLLVEPKPSHLQKNMTELAAVFSNVQSEYQSQCQQRSLQLVLESKPLWLQLDPRHLQLLLSNLISNAIKYSFANSTILIRSSFHNGRASIAVHNQGKGISVSDAKHIFQPFFRSSTAQTQRGIGLGLSIVKRLAEVYGLHIGLTSTPNAETVFTISQIIAATHSQTHTQNLETLEKQ